MSYSPHVAVRPNEPSERRVHSRIRPRTITYIELGRDNGGIIKNMSEGGLSVTVAGFLSEGTTLPVRLRLGASREWTEIPGQIVWASGSRKEVGIRFIELQESELQRIRAWMFAKALSELDQVPVSRTSETPPAVLQEPVAAQSAAAQETASPTEPAVEAPGAETQAAEPALTVTPCVSQAEAPSVPQERMPVPQVGVSETPHEEKPAAHQDASAILEELAAAAGTAPEANAPQEVDEAPYTPYFAPRAEAFEGADFRLDPSLIDPGNSDPRHLDPNLVDPSLRDPHLMDSNPADPNLADRRVPHQGQLRTWLTSISLVSLVALSFFILGVFAGRDTWNRIVELFRSDSAPVTRTATANREAPPVAAPAPEVKTSSPSRTPTQAAGSAAAPPRPMDDAALRALRILPHSVSDLPAPERNRPAEIEQVPDPPPSSAAAPPPAAQEPPAREPAAAAEPPAAEPPLKAPTNPNPQRIAEVPILPPDVSSVPSAAITPPGTDLIPVGSVEIIPDPYPAIRSSSDSKTPILRPGASLVFGRVISKVQPMYPREALQQRMAGPVKLHVVVARDGSVGKLQVMEGPAILAEEARRAVQQWRYEPTRLNGQPIETEENVTIVFRLNNPATPAK